MKYAKAVIIAFLFIMLQGCATPAAVNEMIPQHLTTLSAPRCNKILRVLEVTGGKKTNPMTFASIENEGFGQALLIALQDSGLFMKVGTEPAGDLALKAEIISQELMPGLTMTSVLFVHYSLIDTKTSEDIWKENILSQYDAPLREAFFGPTRAQRAHEGAVRNNLEQLIKKLAKVVENIH